MMKNLDNLTPPESTEMNYEDYQVYMDGRDWIVGYWLQFIQSTTYLAVGAKSCENDQFVGFIFKTRYNEYINRPNLSVSVGLFKMLKGDDAEVKQLFKRKHLAQIGSFTLFLKNVTVAREDQFRVEGRSAQVDRQQHEQSARTHEEGRIDRAGGNFRDGSVPFVVEFNPLTVVESRGNDDRFFTIEKNCKTMQLIFTYANYANYVEKVETRRNCDCMN